MFKTMQTTKNINFSSSKNPSEDISNFIFKTETLMSDNLLLKKNIFLSTSLYFSSPQNHELKIEWKQLPMNRFLRTEIILILANLLPMFNKKQEIELNLSDPFNTTFKTLSEVYFHDYDFHVYKECRIKQHSFSFLTENFINFKLKPLINELSVNDVINLIPITECEELSRLQLRYLKKVNTPPTSTEELIYILSKCL